ncbi:hypothetical protein [Amycolatopsis sp. NPDC051061]|uniref:hypothetical protein n=1 Tax=Amycolatopsis sp. NPDC051061 TaxID=3155042 RepID=UPI0034222826
MALRSSGQEWSGGPRQDNRAPRRLRAMAATPPGTNAAIPATLATPAAAPF